MNKTRYTFRITEKSEKLKIPFFDFLSLKKIHAIDVVALDTKNLPKIGDIILYKIGVWFDSKGNIV